MASRSRRLALLAVMMAVLAIGVSPAAVGAAGCGDRTCSGGETYLTCCSDCSGCANFYCSASRVCEEPLDLVVDVPDTVYWFSQFLISSKEIVNLSSGLPVDAYTLCWQSSCNGTQMINLGCNKNVFSIPSYAPLCTDRLIGLLSVDNVPYRFDYPIKYVQQLKVSSSVFPASAFLNPGDDGANFTLSVQNLDSKPLEINVTSDNPQVLIGGSATYSVFLAVNSTQKIAVKTPPSPGRYIVSISDASGTSEVQTQELVVALAKNVTSWGSLSVVGGSDYFSVKGGRKLLIEVNLGNSGALQANFSLYAKGSAASAVSFGPALPVSLGAGAQKTIPVTFQPTFAAAGEYPFLLCAAPVTGGLESCAQGILNVTASLSGRFELTASTEKVDLRISDKPESVLFAIAPIGNGTRFSTFLETTCPADVLANTQWLKGSVSLNGPTYNDTVQVTPSGRSVSCSFSVTVSDAFGSQKKTVSVSITPSAEDIRAIMDSMKNAGDLINNAVLEESRMKSASEDTTPLRDAISKANGSLEECRQQVGNKSYDEAGTACRAAWVDGKAAMSLAKYSDAAAAMEPPKNAVNVFVVAGVLVVLISTSVILFARLV